MATKTKTKTKTNLDPLRVGNNVFIRTVTTYFTGRVVGVDATTVLLTDAAWIAETGRFSVALATGELGEVEPFPDGAVVSINRGAIVDVTTWEHALPRVAR